MTEVVIVGAGVIGCAIARELAPDHDVMALDRGQIAGETTAKASGLITIVPDLQDHPAAARHSIDFFRAYDGTGEFTLTDRPSVQLVTEEKRAWARDRAETIASNGFGARYLTAAEVEARYPGAFVLDDFVGAIEFDDTGWVDPYTYTMTLKADAEAEGASFLTDVAVDGVATGDGAVTGVTTVDGRIADDEVIVAAGWRTRELLAEHLAVPVRPFRWQAVNLEVDKDIGDSPIAWESVTDIYWRPEHNGDLHVGGGTYFVDEPGDRRDSVTEAYRRLVASTIGDRVAGLGNARIAGEDCCPTGDAATPDNRPIVDRPDDAPDGLSIATGCPIGGVMTSPIVARAVRSHLTGQRCPFPLEAFTLDRFTSRSDTFECSYVSGTSAPETYG